MSHLPTPSLAAQQHSNRLSAIIAAEIQQQGGRIDFQRFMQMALYQPGFGYYSAGADKFGAAGDFVTAPLISPAFSWCLAQQCQQLLTLSNPYILELGAGTGVMALQILQELEKSHALPEKYFILEVSADLRERQQTLIQQQAPHFLTVIEWLDRLPQKPFNGIIIANEVMDAMPVHRVCIDETIEEYYVTFQDGQFHWEKDRCHNQGLLKTLDEMQIQEFINNTPNYTTEINLLLMPWIKSLADCLQQGIILLIDYGYPRPEYFHPQRHMGTLMCHYQHRAHDNPLIFMGIQDITAHVDFTRVAEAALNAELTVGGFTHQAGFLLNCGLTQYAANHHSLETAQQIKRLTLPSQMGERFKAIALTKDFDEALLGFSSFNQDPH